MRKSAITMCLFLSFLSVSWGIATIDGITGLIQIPTAESLKYKEINFSYDYQLADVQAKDIGIYKVNLGTYKNLELGIIGGRVPSGGVYVNIKYHLMSEESRYPLALAVGVEDLTSISDSSVYMVASKKVQNGLDLHGGFNAKFYKDSIQPNLMAGIEYYIDKNISLVIDGQGDNGVMILNTGIRYFMYPNIALKISYLDIAQSTEDTKQWVFGLDISKFL